MKTIAELPGVETAVGEIALIIHKQPDQIETRIVRNQTDRVEPQEGSGHGGTAFNERDQISDPAWTTAGINREKPARLRQHRSSDPSRYPFHE